MKILNLKMTPLEKIHASYVITKSIVSDDNVEDDIELRKLADKFFIDYKTRVVVVANIFFSSGVIVTTETENA